MRVLVVTYYWPPAGGPGVQRWLKFVKYFKEFGIEPVVYIPENPMYPLEDASLLVEVPNDITILKQPIFEPYNFAQFFSKKETKTMSKGMIAKKEQQSIIQRVLLYVRGNFFIPDGRKFWVKPSVKYLKAYIHKNNIEAVITTGPPHSVHLIGLQLQRRLGVKWVADFRDPWTTIGYHHQLKLSRRSKHKHKALESEVLQNADQLIVTSFTTKKEFQEITNHPISVITNGYDDENNNATVLDTKFTVSHIGSLLSGRNPIQLWSVFYDLIEEYPDFAASFRLQLVGAVSDEVLSAIKKAGLSDFLDIIAYVPHQEAIKIQRSSQVLLLIEIDSPLTKCIIPGKLFEYMISKRPILAIGPKDADISALIKETNSGCFYEYHEYQEMKKTILDYFEKFKAGTLKADTIGVEKYSRKELTRTLSNLLEAL